MSEIKNELTVFNTEVIPVYTTSTGEKAVIGRELHEGLKIETPYTQWFDRMAEYGFKEYDSHKKVKNLLGVAQVRIIFLNSTWQSTYL